MNTLNRLILSAFAVVFIGMITGCATTSERADVSKNKDSGTTEMAASERKQQKKTVATEGTVIQEDGKDSLICRKIKPTGTRFAETWCLTQAEWSGLQTSGKRSTETLQKGGMYGQPAGGGG